ncbi:MAG: hypothetical protein HZB53_21910 [Chloroflexi bacterium]|nr:hypothetical protein [Chloroflexota bacterium]
MSLNVRIPDALMRQVEQRASAEGKPPETWVIEAVEKQLDEESASTPSTHHERVRAALKAAGLSSEVSSELIQRYVKPRTQEEVELLRERIQRISITPPLSETIIAGRGPKS